MAKIELFEHHNEDVTRPEGVRTTWMSITPEYATKVITDYEKFCDEHPSERKNRPVHQSQVNTYMADMKAGRWGRNHQGIAFDKNGILMDGQHRIWAVIESGVTIMIPVTWGLDREAQITIDSGLKRSTADVAAIVGFEGVTAIHVGIAKAIVRGVGLTKPSNTRIQELEMLRDHWKAIEFTLSCFPKSKVRAITRAPVMAVIARAYYTQDAEKLRKFTGVLVSGITSDDKDHIIITLRNWLMTTKGAGGQMTTEVYGKTTRALEAFLKGEKLRTLYATKTEVFTLPVLKKK
jgi:hypothetical protein